MRNRFPFLVALTVVIALWAVPSSVLGNTIPSSTMIFQGTLTDNGDGTYTGVVAMIDEGGLDSGYDIYGEEGANAWFGNDPGSGPVWTSQLIGADHDAWPTWTPDTPDWYQYSLDLYEDAGVQKWAVRNHAGATAVNPWYDEAHWGVGGLPARGVPMSGVMEWTSLYAAETETGAYLPGTGTPEIPGGAAGYGGGAGAWDMDWSWGSEVVPLELAGFDVDVQPAGGSLYDVTLTPAGPEEVWVDDNFNASTPGWGVTHFAEIKDGIDAVSGSLVNVANGIYYETLNITTDSLSIIGENRATVIIDPTGLASNGAGIYVDADDVTLKSLTLRSTVTNSTPRYGIKFGEVDGGTLEDVTARDVYRSGIDALGASNLTIYDVSSLDNGGHGLSLVDCNNVDVTDITLSGNGWQNVSVATWGHYTPLGTSGIVFDGTNSFGDLFQLEMGDYNLPGNPPAGAAIITYSTNILDGADVTVQASDFGFAVHGEQDDSPDQVRIWFFSTLANAALVPALAPIGHWTGNDMYIESLTDDTQSYVTSGCTIQAAIDAADPGDKIDVAAGSYEEQLNIDKAIEIAGAGADSTTVLSPVTLTDFFMSSVANYPVVYIHETDGVNFHDFTVDGAGRGNNNYRYIGIGFWKAGGTIEDCDIVNIQDTPFSGVQHGNGIYAWNDEGTAHTVNVSGCNVTDYQKGGIIFNGSLGTGHVSDCVVTGKGATTVTAQNGIQFGWGAGGTITDCTSSGHIYTGGGWASAGALFYLATTVDVSGDCLFEDNSPGIYAQEVNGSMTDGVISNQDPDSWDALYVITSGATAKMADDRLRKASPSVENGNYVAEKVNRSFSLDGCSFIGHGKTDSWGVYFKSTGDLLTVDMDNCTVGGWDYGVFVREDGGTVNTTARENSIAGNGAYGWYVDGTTDQDAVDNWWGDPTGPHHGTLNNGGLGDEVSDHVLFNPWKTGNIVFVPDPEVLTATAGTKTISVDYLGGGSGLVYGYNVSFTWNGLVASTSTAQVTEGNLLSDQGATQWYINQVGNTITVHNVLLGAQPGVTGPGTMFTIQFDAVACGTTGVDLTVNAVRDNNNQPLGGFFEDDGLIYVDQGLPSFTVNNPWPDGLCHATAPSLDLSAAANCGDLDSAFYKYDAGAWTPSDPNLFTDYDGSSWTNGAWVLPGFGALGEGTHTVYFYCTDDFGNVSATVSWDFIKDTVDPPPVTDFASAPGNGKTHLSWTNPGSDFDHVVVVRKAWDGSSPYGYADYAQPAAGYPANPSDGVVVYSGTGSSCDDDPIADRSIYFYHAFVYDCASNFTGGTPPTGPVPAAFAQGDRTTSYWLGDVAVAYDGYVNYSDITTLSGTYWLADGESGWNSECDVGPTDDWSRVGIPLPDDFVDFEDLIVFAMNFNVVDPSGKTMPPVLLAGEKTAANPTLRLEGAPAGKGLYEVILVLDGNVREVKGASIELRFNEEALSFASAAASEALVKSRAFFIADRVGRGLVKIDLAALGTGRTIEGSGEIARITFHASDVSGELGLRLGDVVLRGAGNTKLTVSIDDIAFSQGATVPSVTRLVGAVPNPFNPTTAVAYELSAPERVSVNIYDAQGRLVRTLVDQSQSAGHYEAVWNGRDNAGRACASGVYLVRMVAGEYGRTSKLVMLK